MKRLKLHKKIIIESAIMLLIALYITSLTVMAYFTATSSIISIGENINGSGWEDAKTVEISSENDLRLASYDDVFLSTGDSNSQQGEVEYKKQVRKILVFKEDITLTSDLIIESDVMINLGEKNLDLNGFNVTLHHNYHSSTSIINGTVKNSVKDIDTDNNAKFYIETPNAAVSVENVNGSDDFIVINEYSFDRVVSEIKSFLTSVTAKYYVGDVFIVYNYKNYPVTIEYSSNNQTVVKDWGVVTIPETDTAVTLTVKITDKANTSKTSNFDLDFTVLCKNSITNLGYVGIEIIDDYFARYTYKGADASTVSFTHIYHDSIGLITNDEYYGVKYKYYIVTEELDINGDPQTIYTQLTATGPDGKTPYLDLKEVNGSITIKVEVCLENYSVIANKEYEFYSSSNRQTVTNAVSQIGIALIDNKDGEKYPIIPLDPSMYYWGLRVKNIEISFVDGILHPNGIDTYNTSDAFNVIDTDFDIDEDEDPTDILRFLGIELKTALEADEKDLPYYFDITFTFDDGFPQTITIRRTIYVFNVFNMGEESFGGDYFIRNYYELLTSLTEQLGELYVNGIKLTNYLYGSGIMYHIIVPDEILAKYPYATAENIFGVADYSFTDEVFTGTEFYSGRVNGEDTGKVLFKPNLLYVPPENFSVTIKIYFEYYQGTILEDPNDPESNKTITKIYTKDLTLPIPGILSNTRPDGYNPEIPDINLYKLMLENCDISRVYLDLTEYKDKILYLDEATNYIGEFIIDPTFISASSPLEILDFKGLKYLYNVKKIKVNNIRFGSGNILFGSVSEPNKSKSFTENIIKAQITELSINNCQLQSAHLQYVNLMFKLTKLDVSRNNITNLTNLPPLLSVTELNLSYNNITTYEYINNLYSITILHMDTTIGKSIMLQPLMDLKKLNTIYLYKEITGVPLTAGDYRYNMSHVFASGNHTKYVLMYNFGVRFFYMENDTIPYQIAPPTEDENTCAVVLEAIYYFGIERTIILPSKLIEETNAGKPTHIITWKYKNIAIIQGIIDTNITASFNDVKNLLTISGAGLTSDLKITLEASVTVNGTTMAREIIITIN